MVLTALAGYLVVQYLTAGTGATGCTVVSAADDDEEYEFTPEQAVNAATVTAVGTARGLPERAVTIALATALQESALHNVRHGDRDSLGLFQQRPSQGWGTPARIMDPTYAAGKFYDHLVDVPGYTRLPLTVAAQRVQRSGFPEAYAKHEPDAALLAAALTGRSAATLTCAGRPGAARAGGPQAVRAALVRDFGRAVLRPDGAADASPVPRSATSARSVRHAETAGRAAVAGGSDGRTVTLPVAAGAGPDAVRSVRRRGWQLAHWAVANASALHIERVVYAGREWRAGIAGNTVGRWQALEAAGTRGAERSTGSVRIVTAQ
ncbi:heavy metal transporter [Streptomyces sp. ISL-12]|uniref:heavy metal transporter n=1 Tax=Streptomyces sp. ISL-12 TaxID=2819177 RepID=UPI001BE646B6|nr:heavy metal transporter [Streptomyces sp. ISL-12]MBT2415940.1 heavy metal transporter [Streptomyces sp. ISL-12]